MSFLNCWLLVILVCLAMLVIGLLFYYFTLYMIFFVGSLFLALIVKLMDMPYHDKDRS